MELDAFDPLKLRDLYWEAIELAGWDEATYQAVLALERIEVNEMRSTNYWDGWGEWFTT